MASSSSSPGGGGIHDPAKGSPSSAANNGLLHGGHMAAANGGGNNSLAIRQEIQRFESVHPSIYAIYDLIELIPDPLLAQQVREHVVCIEDSFVNSQEWTLSRGVPDLRLGIVGSLSSGKSALVHRYLTGSYMQEESPEGGRFKKEIVVDGQSFLLLIRDEGGPPESQFTSWVDAVIFVFSLENEASFNAIYNYYAKMSQLRNMLEVPLILVGTQDAISEGRPRVVDDSRARKLASDLRRCAYYETCATYGLNVERVFQDACHKIASTGHHRPVTPTAAGAGAYNHHRSSLGSSGFLSSPSGGAAAGNGFVHSSSNNALVPSSPMSASAVGAATSPAGGGSGSNNTSMSNYKETRSSSNYDFSRISTSSVACPPSAIVGPPADHHHQQGKFAVPMDRYSGDSNKENFKSSAELPVTPTSTPTSARKSRRRSNLFTPSKKGAAGSGGSGGAEDRNSTNSAGGFEQLGSGRSIPVRQGYLYKKSSKSFSKDWKKKYVTLCDDGRMTYHPSLHDYMENIHGKEIPLQYVTVKVPGQKPRGSRSIPGGAAAGANPGGDQSNVSGLVTDHNRGGKGEKVLLTGYELLKDPSGGEDAAGENGNAVPNGGGGGAPGTAAAALDKLTDTPNVKKRHRRIKSNGVKANQDCEDPDMFEFHIVSLDNKQWYFDASSAEERDEWVTAIEQQILSSLQGNESNKAKGQSSSAVDVQTMKTIKNDIPGNLKCVDCDAPNPDWASLNLGVLMCIECSGIHRQLGTHISRVRSLDLDEWPPGHLAVMVALGNRLANTVWEATKPGARKPGPQSSPEEKERYIKAKYSSKEFLSPWPPGASPSSTLVDAVCRSDVRSVLLVLSHSPSPDDVNAPVSPRDGRTPLHLAAALGNLAMTQMLIWANANVKSLDHEGRTCVSYARSSGCQELVDLLLSNGCPDVSLSGTLPRRKPGGPMGGVVGRKADMFDKIASSVL